MCFNTDIKSWQNNETVRRGLRANGLGVGGSPKKFVSDGTGIERFP